MGKECFPRALPEPTCGRTELCSALALQRPDLQAGGLTNRESSNCHCSVRKQESV